MQPYLQSVLMLSSTTFSLIDHEARILNKSVMELEDNSELDLFRITSHTVNTVK